jgi:CRP-like cAMP-binding protein
LVLKLEAVPITVGDVLFEPWVKTTHVYFPTSGLVSLVAVADGGNALEVGLIGRRGMVGVSLALGVSQSPARALVQSGGIALRMGADAFRAELKRNKLLRNEVSRYANTAMATSMQIAVCNNAHLLSARLARWLLMTSDCLSANTFFQTQEFLALMLGVRRGGISGVAGNLQRRKLITYRRGSIAILDRAGLRDAACSCYETIRKLDAG